MYVCVCAGGQEEHGDRRKEKGGISGERASEQVSEKGEAGKRHGYF